MRNKKTIAIILIIVTFFIIPSVYVQIGKRTLYSKTLQYLINNKGYKKSEFRIENPRHSFINRVLSYPEWGIDVIFNDETTKTYVYTYAPNDKNSIMQYGGVGGKHFEND